MTGVGERRASCEPKLCALASDPHLHCFCGLPMAPDATACRLCIDEQVVPTEQPRRRTSDPEAWDGLSYPSLRCNRTGRVDRERYLQLLEVVLSPSEPDGLRLDGLLSRHRARESDSTVEGVPSPAALQLANELANEAGQMALITRSGGEER